MKSAKYARTLLILSLLGCGSRSSLDFAEEDGGSGGERAAAGTGGHSGAGAGGAVSRGGAAGTSAGFGGTPSSGGRAGSSSLAGSGGVAGAPVCERTGPEVCDGIDNDCNGVIDDGNVCPCDAQSFGGRSYLFCRAVAAWQGAQGFCARYGYQLASIHDATTDHWLGQTVVSYANAKWWMGLDDLTQKSRWQWQDGTPVDYLNWGPGEPNDAGGIEDCAELNRYGVDGGWNDEPCDGALPFVCESNAHSR
jgi:hypothetical protein